MPRQFEEPIETKRHDETTINHPSFGQITVSRVSGQKALYGSDFVHNGWVQISVYPSELRRNYSKDWYYHGVRPLIQFDLSEAQWSAMVASFGMGEGTPVTLTKANGEWLPEFKVRDSQEIYDTEAEAVGERIMSRLVALRDAVEQESSGLSKSKKAVLASNINSAIQELSSNLPFVMDSFRMNLEKRKEKAKIEIAAWMQSVITRAGIKSLTGGKSSPIEIESD